MIPAATGLVLAVVGLITAVLVAGLWFRRNERVPDGPTHRSAAVFSARDEPPRPTEEALDTLSSAPGLGLVQRVADGLVARGHGPCPVGWDNPCWETSPEALSGATVQLRAIDDAQWLVQVVALSGAPANLDAVKAVHAALVDVADGARVSWYRRERALAGDLSDGQPTPDVP